MGLILVHMEALKNKGNTIAVIGTGLDVYYPKENKALQDYMTKNHLVLLNMDRVSSSSTTFLNATGLFLIVSRSYGRRSKTSLGESDYFVCVMKKVEMFLPFQKYFRWKVRRMPSPNSRGRKCITTGFDILSEFP